MDAALIWAGIGAAGAVFVLWYGYRAGRDKERAKAHKADTKAERAKSNALEQANAANPGSIRERLRAIARRRS